MFITYRVVQMREAGRRAGHYGVTLPMLMGSAGSALAKAALEICPNLPIAVVCGRGNNGGDGYVCAAALRLAGVDVTVLGINRDSLEDDSLAGASALIYERLGGVIRPLTENTGAIDLCALIVDAVFGIGLTRPVTGVYAHAIRLINRADAQVLSCDVPSGIDADTGQIMGEAVRADVTLMLGLAKPACYLEPGSRYFGELRLADIGLPEELIASL